MLLDRYLKHQFTVLALAAHNTPMPSLFSPDFIAPQRRWPSFLRGHSVNQMTELVQLKNNGGKKKKYKGCSIWLFALALELG